MKIRLHFSYAPFSNPSPLNGGLRKKPQLSAVRLQPVLPLT